MMNNAPRPCLFMVFYLLLSFCHLVYHRVPNSVLGPLVLRMYVHHIGIVTHRYQVKYHLFVYDTQLYISLDPENQLHFSSFLNNLEHCIAVIRLWITEILLRINYDKTNIIYLASPEWAKSLKTPALQMGES